MPIDLNPQDIVATRKANLLRLIAKFGGRPALIRQVEQSDYNHKPVVTQVTLTGWLSGDRSFGRDVCRRLERTLSMPEGTLDVPEVTDESLTLPLLDERSAIIAITTRIVAIGDGSEWPKQAVPADRVRDNRFTVHWGDDTMAAGPRAIAPGSLIIVCLDTPCENDNLVLAAVDDALLLRRLVVSGPQRWLQATNERYDASLRIPDVPPIGLARALCAITNL